MIGAENAITWADLTSVFSSITGQFTVIELKTLVKSAHVIAFSAPIINLILLS